MCWLACMPLPCLHSPPAPKLSKVLMKLWWKGYQLFSFAGT